MAMTQAIKNKWIEAGIPNAENLIVDEEPTPQDPTVNYGPGGTGGPGTLPGGGPDDEQGPEDLEEDPSSLPGIPGLGGPGIGDGGIPRYPTGGAGTGLDPSSGGGPAGPGYTPSYPIGGGGGGGLARVRYGEGGGGGGGGAGGGGGGGRSRANYDPRDRLLPDFPPSEVGGPGQGGGSPVGSTSVGSGLQSAGSTRAGPAPGYGKELDEADKRARKQRQEYLEDLKNYRTLDLPDEAVSGVNRLVESYNTAYGEARGANEARYQQLLGITDQTTGQRAADIRGDAESERSDLQQGLARTGLANTTVSPTLTAGVRRREQESLNRLADQMQGTKLGIIERREDQYPDAASLQSSLAGLSEGYGGKGVSALYGALGNIQQGGGGGAAPAVGGAFGASATQPAGAPLSETGLGPAVPGVPGLPTLPGSESFGADQFTTPGAPTVKRKGGNVFGTL